MQERDREFAGSLFMRAMRAGGVKRLLLVMPLGLICLLLVFTGANAVGVSQASSVRQFLVQLHSSRGQDDLLVLRRYGDQVVVAPLDRQRNQVLRRYALMSLVNPEGRLWTLEDIEPPTLAEPVGRKSCDACPH